MITDYLFVSADDFESTCQRRHVNYTQARRSPSEKTWCSRLAIVCPREFKRRRSTTLRGPATAPRSVSAPSGVRAGT